MTEAASKMTHDILRDVTLLDVNNIIANARQEKASTDKVLSKYIDKGSGDSSSGASGSNSGGASDGKS